MNKFSPSHRLTQYKRFVPYRTHQNFCFAKTSFMLEPLYEIAPHKRLTNEEELKW